MFANSIVSQRDVALQVVANEFFDPVGRFNQATWAKQLLATLKVRW